jgi:hypothetical protein
MKDYQKYLDNHKSTFEQIREARQTLIKNHCDFDPQGMPLFITEEQIRSVVEWESYLQELVDKQKPERAKFVRHKGTSFEVCPVCGVKLPNDVLFNYCPNCGKHIKFFTSSVTCETCVYANPYHDAKGRLVPDQIECKNGIGSIKNYCDDYAPKEGGKK